jgi:hypothetical protein
LTLPRRTFHFLCRNNDNRGCTFAILPRTFHFSREKSKFLAKKVRILALNFQKALLFPGLRIKFAQIEKY